MTKSLRESQIKDKMEKYPKVSEKYNGEHILICLQLERKKGAQSGHYTTFNYVVLLSRERHWITSLQKPKHLLEKLINL